MNMAFSGMHRFIFTTICISAGFAKAFVKLDCKTENSGQYGQESLLNCVIKMSQEMDSEIRVVTWRKGGEDKPLLSFYRGKTENQEGYSFAERSWNPRNMNVSLLITNTAVKDKGVYECEVVTNRGEAEGVTNLKVTAKYSTPTINSIPEAKTGTTVGTLVCESNGGYPKGKISWYGEQGEDWTKSAELEVKETEDGLFQLTSRLSLLRGSIFSKYTCVVFNATGGKEEEAAFEIPPDFLHNIGREGDNPSVPVSKVIAPVVVIGSLIVGLLLALLFYRRRSRPHHEVRQDSGGDDADDDLERGETKQHNIA